MAQDDQRASRQAFQYLGVDSSVNKAARESEHPADGPDITTFVKYLRQGWEHNFHGKGPDRCDQAATVQTRVGQLHVARALDFYAF
eukprot:9063908-Pyramimonas_sp.AAC.1